MKLSNSTTLAAVVVIGAAGFFTGRLSSPAAASAAADESGQLATARSSSARPADAAGQSSSARGKRSRQNALGDTFANDSPEEKLVRLESIVRGGNALDRTRALLAYIDQLAPGEFQDAVARFRGLGITGERMGEYSMMLTAWAQVDPTAALAYAKENTGSGFAANTIIATWAANDPDAAIRWAESNHTGDSANPYFAGIIRSIAASDPARASSLLTSMPRSTERGEALDALLPHLLAQGTSAARAWIDTLTDTALRDGSMMRIADQLAKADPKGTADWLVANPGDAASRRLDDVFDTWAKSNQPAALAYYQTLPPGEARSNALRGVVSAITNENPSAAAAMIDRYPADISDRTLQTFVWRSYGNDPSLAVNYIGRIADAGDRDRMYVRTLGSWLGRDPATAQTWIQSNNLPPNVQKQLAEMNQENR